MRTLAKILALSIGAMALVAPASAAPMGGGGGGGGGGAILPQGGVGGHAGGSFSAGGGVSGGLAARPGGTPGHFTARSGMGAGSTFSGQTGVTGQRFGEGDDWRRRHRHSFPGAVYGLGNGLYGGDYYDEPDVNQCWVYRRIYNARGMFIGWRHVDICTG